MLMQRMRQVGVCFGAIALVVCAGYSARAQDALQGRWHMDEGTGAIVADSSGNGNTGTVTNGTWAAGHPGSAVAFDGSSTYVDCGNTTSLNSVLSADKLTFAAWVYPVSVAGEWLDGDIMGFSGNPNWGYSFRICSGTGCMALCFQDTGGDWHYLWSANYLVHPDQWSHLAVTYDASEGRAAFYVNGALRSEATETATADNEGGTFKIGLVGWQDFPGIIDEAEVYSRALSESEVADKVLLADWHFSEGTGSTAHDSTINDNDGTLSNATWVEGRLGQGLSFNGTSSYVSAGNRTSLNSILLSDKFTMEAWVYPEDEDGDIMGFAGCDAHWGYTFRLCGRHPMLSFEDSGDTYHHLYASGALATLNAWNHVMVSYDAAAGKAVFYLNGEPTEVSCSATSDSTNGTFKFGIVGWHYFDGIIDEAKVYDRVVGDAEIGETYLQGLCLANWHCDDGSGSTAYDSSGNANDGTLHNISSWTTGKSGSGLPFDGTSSYISVGNRSSLNSILLSDKFTMEAWVYPEDEDGDIMGFAGCDAHWGYTFRLCGRHPMLSFEDSGDTYHHLYPSGVLVPLNTWSHLMVSYDATEGKAVFYLNGEPTEVSCSATCDSTNGTFKLGIVGWHYFDGIIDEAKVYGFSELTGFGCEVNPTGDPIGGGEGYSHIVDPDALNFGAGDYYVTDSDALIAALQTVTSGHTVFVDGDSQINLTGRWDLLIPAGVTLASDRGRNGSSGALLYTTTTTGYSFEPLLVAGAGVRVTGLRIRGPYEGMDYDGLPLCDGVRTTAPDLEVDNCEMWGWPHAAVYLMASSDTETPTDAKIHHNYIHHCQRDESGYGVMHGGHSHPNGAWHGEATSVIEANKFDYCRHVVAATGSTGNSYEARYNLCEEHLVSSKYYNWDCHGGVDRGDGTDVAGDAIFIHHNTIRCGWNGPMVLIHGVPNEEARIEHNWFYGEYPGVFPYRTENTFIYRNIYTETRNLR